MNGDTMGTLRAVMLRVIPDSIEGLTAEGLEDVRDSLKDLIDDLEQRVLEISNLMSIDNIRDISEIEKAYDKLQDLANDLY